VVQGKDMAQEKHRLTVEETTEHVALDLFPDISLFTKRLIDHDQLEI
jgi:hypothetical protein